MKYRWRELEVFTIQTLSNIITYIQFALTPLELITPESKSNEKDLILLVNKKFNSIIRFFSSPLNFIRKYNNIIGPIRTMLSAVIFNAIIIFLYSIFFLPSWHFIVFILDIIIPACFLFGIVFISRKYEEKYTISIILIIIGIIYFIIRITFYFLHLFKQKKVKWYVNCAQQISSVFFSRLKKNHDIQDEITEELRYKIDENTIFIQFDEFHFPYKKRIIDFIITSIIWFFILIFVILKWEKILHKSCKGKLLEDISLISNNITYSLFVLINLRLIINVIWLIKPIEKTTFKIFRILHKLAYKGMHFLACISLIPILGMALKAISIELCECRRYYFYDTRSNTDSLITYFMKKEDLCVRCTHVSIDSDPACLDICRGYFYIAKDSSILAQTLYELYFIPILIFDLFYSVFVIFWLRSIAKKIMDVLVTLPAPTRNIECKFQTLINILDSPALNTFRSYKYKNALYSFFFTEVKLSVYFWTNLTFCEFMPFDDYFNPIILCFGVSFVSFYITESQLFKLPYISILHNIVNFFSYFIAGVSSFLVGLHVCYLIKMKQQLAIFLLVMIVATPILTTLITPFFAKKDPLLFPTEFDLLKIQKWDKKLIQISDFRRRKSKAKKKRNKKENSMDDFDDNDGILFEDEPSISVSKYQNHDDQREHDLLVSNFELIKLAPIQIQENLNKDDDDEFRNKVEEIWPKIFIDDDCFDNATNEMIHSSNQLINCISYENLIRFFNFSLIFSSACLGWCLSSGIERWQKIFSPQWFRYYLRCNMFFNGTFPDYGTY